MRFIGITQRLVENDSYYELRETLSTEWGMLFKTHFQDFLPLPLSYGIDFNVYAQHLCAVILSGGNDLNALSPSCINAMRDVYENQVIAYCLAYHLPLLGICRGAQMIAHYFGSTLEPLSSHTSPHFVEDSTHKKMIVNSFHRYGITHLGDALVAYSKAEDSSIESFAHKNAPIFGIMWHIEREEQNNGDDVLRQWRAFIESR